MNNSKGFKITAIILVVVVLIGEIAFGAKMVMDNNQVLAYIKDQQKKEAEALATPDYIEDGYKVMEMYEIRSTRAISDAFISGDDSALSDEDKETLEMAKAAIEEMGITDEMSMYDKEVAIYDWIYDNIGHGQSTVISTSYSNASCYTPHDVLKYRNAVCVGYATTFRMFLEMYGFNVHIAHNESHSWDLVQLDDGEWYYTDLYMDAGSTRYGNFNMDETMCLSSHSLNASALPEAKGTQYMYCVLNHDELASATDLVQYIYDFMYQPTSKKYVCVANYKDEDELTLSLIIQQFTSFFYSDMAGETYGNDLYASWVYDGDDMKILQLNYYNYNNYGEGDYAGNDNIYADLSSETRDSIRNIFNSIFGEGGIYLDMIDYADSATTTDPGDIIMGGDNEGTEEEVTEGEATEENTEGTEEGTDDSQN